MVVGYAVGGGVGMLVVGGVVLGGCEGGGVGMLVVGGGVSGVVVGVGVGGTVGKGDGCRLGYRVLEQQIVKLLTLMNWELSSLT